MRIRLNAVVLAFIASSAIGFGRSFFEERLFAGRLSRITDVAIVVLIGTSLLFAFAAPWQIVQLDRLISLGYAAMIAIAVTMMWRAWRLRSTFWMLMLAWSVPFGLYAARISHNLGLISWRAWLDYSTIVGMAAETLGASLAIAYRIRLLARERDAARAEEMAARLLADSDPLTGLLNRRAFLAQGIGRAEPQTLMILDIDRFKTINDTIGHDGGDEVLRRVAAVLRAQCPADGLTVRLGGEEFALLAPADRAPSAGDILDALRAARMPYDLTVTASIGGCTGPLVTEADWKALYRTADRALFAAKDAGRDRARVIGAPAVRAA